MRVAVLGAAGLMGRTIVRDLRESPEISTLTELDRERSRAAGADIAAVDAGDRQQLTLALEGVDLLVNAADYRVNRAAMDAALAARCSYVDLGGLYHETARQLTLHPDFEQAGLLAVLGCGAGPGKTNVMAAWAAEGLDAVHVIRCASAGHDAAPPPGVSLPYSLRTLLDELTEPPIVLRGGEPVALEPLANGGVVDFPEPIGPRGSLHTLHSEVLTLGASLGAADVDFRLALAPRVEQSLRQILRGAAPPPIAPPSAHTSSAQVAEVSGLRDGRPVTVRATASTGPHEAWQIGGGVVSTASVAAAVVRLWARGALTDPTGFAPLTGVHPPERALHHSTLFPELERRGCRFSITTHEVQAP
jgi:saccharopine dehydrogenase-like NADP-dependent oxidoreductase